MTSKVMLTVTGEQTDADGNIETTAMRGHARYERRGSVHRLLYTETDPDSGVRTDSGMQISDRACVLARQGAVRTRMRMILGRVTACRYGTPYGTVELEIDTKQITLLESEDTIKARIVYMLRFGDKGEEIRNAVTIVIKAED